MALAVMVGIVLGLCSRLINFQFPSQVSWFAAPGAALGLCIQHKQAPGRKTIGEVWMLDVEGRQYKWPTNEIQAYFMRQGLAIYTWGTGCFFQVPRTSQMLHLDKNFWINTSRSKCMLKWMLGISFFLDIDDIMFFFFELEIMQLRLMIRPPLRCVFF